MPQSVDDDLVSVMQEFRRERLVIRSTPDPAVFTNSDELPGWPSQFILDNGKVRYVQLVAMPIGKARALYVARHGEALLSASREESITGLRRRWVDPRGDWQVEFYLLTRQHLTALHALAEDIEVCAIISACSIADDAWRKEWITPGVGPVQRLAVLIDEDPFAMLERTSDHAVRTAVLKVRRRPDDADQTEVVCLVDDHEPTVLNFTPCTTPFRQALLEFARRRCPLCRLDNAVVTEWSDILERVVGHVLREERIFGIRFW